MIEIHHLRKEYDGNVALENLHLEIPEGDLTPLGDPAQIFMNVNTPDELARARALAGERG